MFRKTTCLSAIFLLPFTLHLVQPCHGEETAARKTKPLIDLKSQISEKRLLPTSEQVSVTQDTAASALVVKIQPGKEGYPGLHITPEVDSWDLSEFGHIEARIVNTGKKDLSFVLRVDGKADGADFTSNTESVTIKPGETRTAKVIFGFTYGYKPAMKPNPAAISRIVCFSSKSEVEKSFRIETLEAAGPAGETPPVIPANVRTKPEKGVILGSGVALDAKQLEAKDGVQAAIEGASLKLSYLAGTKPQEVVLKPLIGRWDLRDAFEVKVKVKNTGTAAVMPKVKITSNGGPTDSISPSAPLQPGAETVIAVPFASAIPWQGIKGLEKTSWEGQPGTGTKFTSDAVSGVSLSTSPADAPQSLLVTEIVAGVPVYPEMPEWLGKRPPVDGDWEMTFKEEFDGTTLDESKWRIYTENYWDKRSHFSKNNVVLGGGVVKLHYEKKTGFHNDDPNGKKTDYATGFLDTYGKWVQRYGYFEARMKLTKAPGLWPAFWLMPDRGVAAGPQWKRADTGNGGMEFDVMEYLGRWGPFRYNIAMHWDGYGKEHKQTGTTTIYFLPDKDGFITAGVLWTPGLIVYYANGKEIARWESPKVSTVQSDIMFTNVS
ncbi:MAG: family 16 glycosylhydrolase, partial [Gloeobacteraceae cyanobacterium ES-bin-144]|nr:family 16 glycosylhydrolase [Verrucomicrobiales bacterium]